MMPHGRRSPFHRMHQTAAMVKDGERPLVSAIGSVE
jgi:hypothetical protein